MYTTQKHTDAHICAHAKQTRASGGSFAPLYLPQATALLKFIGVINVIPFFGGSFTQVFPWFIFVIALMTLLNVWGHIGRLLNMERFQYVAAPELGNEAHQDMRDAVHEGKKLIEVHMRNEARAKEQMHNQQRLESGTASMLV